MKWLAICVVGVFACSPNEPGPSGPDARPPDPNARWQRVTLDSAAAATGVFVGSSGSVWLAGPEGIRPFRDGSWQPLIAPPSDSGGSLFDVYVDGDEIVASKTPQLLRYSGGAWSTVGELDNCAWDQVRIAGADGALFAGCPYYAGFARWGDRAFALAKEQIIIYDLVALAPDDVIVAGSLGVYHYTGFSLGTDTNEDWQLLYQPDGLFGFPSLWADREGHVVLSGEDGTVLHGDRTALTPIETPSSARLNAIFGTRYDDLFAVGNAGVIWHFDGVTWSAMESGVTTDLLDIHGSADGLDVWAAGADGIVLRLQR